MTTQQLRIPAGSGEELDAWVYLPQGPEPHPTVVMAHGIGGVKAAGLAPFAEHFAAHGFAAVAFDYRHWGRSTGAPRELLSINRQLADYRTALAFARAHQAVDADRIFVWGTSFAGMHIVELAASETYLAGAIAQCPWWTAWRRWRTSTSGAGYGSRFMGSPICSARKSAAPPDMCRSASPPIVSVSSPPMTRWRGWHGSARPMSRGPIASPPDPSSRSAPIAPFDGPDAPAARY